LLVDGNAVLHRAYYALPDWRNRSGEATAGVYGFLSMLLKANDELEPTHLAVVFDCPEPTFRHTMYVGYQVTREKDRQVSEDIWGQVEKLKVVFEKMGVPVFAVPGFEADDLIATNPELVRRFTRGFVAAIQYAQTHRDFTIKVLSKYMRTDDKDILNASYDYFVGRVIPRTPYVSEKGLQAVIDFIRQRNPQTPNVKVQDFMDNRFIKELDEGGFIKSLYSR